MEISVRLAKKNEYEQVKKLYSMVFEDSEEYKKFFFGNLLENTPVVGCFEDEKLVSMIMIREKILIQGNKKVKAAYLYGVATAKEARGKGYMKKNMEYFFEKFYKKVYDMIYLIPVNPAIYEGIGFNLVRQGENISLDNEVRVCDSSIVIKKADISHAEMLSEFAMESDRIRGGIYIEKDEQYFKNRYLQAKAENADIFMLYECLGAEEELKAVIITGSDELGKTCVAEVICQSDNDMDMLYASELVARISNIRPVYRRYPISVFGIEAKNLLEKDIRIELEV